MQALLFYNIADKELTAGELRTRGYYLGSNVSYKVKKLVETGYLHHARSRIDRRAVRISLTDKGREIHEIVSAAMSRLMLKSAKRASLVENLRSLRGLDKVRVR